jgi:23S rRNA (cytidine2498-2'-O)-methyltransferase
MTFKSSDEARDDPEPRAVFARAHGRSLGFAGGTVQMAELAAKLEGPLRVHVFARDPVDPDRTPIDDAPVERTREELLAALGDRVLEDPRPDVGDRVLDVVLAPADEPALVGWHVHDPDRSPAPGGGHRIAAPDDAPSRAWSKLEEALVWSGLPLEADDVVVEIGAAPGGAAAALLQRGAEVIGIDPARIDARVLGHPRFRYLGILAERVRTRDLPERCDWLLLDANVAPHKAMVALGQLLSLRQFRGLLLTLKLNDEGVVNDLPQLLARVHELAGPSRMRASQLPSAHREVIVWVDRTGI